MIKSGNINAELELIKKIAYDKCFLIISDLEIEPEGKEYKACNFKLSELNIICRNAKITPKKNGQFVTFWRRNKNGITEPYDESDPIDFYVVNVIKEERIGQFIFPKSVLIKNGIMSTAQKDGKRGFRVYPKWDSPNSKKAEKTQKWQTEYFIEFDHKVDLSIVKKLYEGI